MKNQFVFNRVLLSLFLLVFGLVLQNCSIAGNDNEVTELQRDLNDRNKIVSSYQAIEGVYEGSLYLKQSNQTIPAKLIMTYREVSVGNDNEGQLRYRPRLFARFSRPEALFLDVKMEGVFEPTTRDITLSSIKEESESYYLRTQMDGDIIRGTLKLGEQNYGELNLKLKTKILPSEIDQEIELRQAIREKLAPLTGNYECLVTPDPSSGLKPFSPEVFKLVVSESQGRLPQLMLYYRQSNAFVIVTTPVTYKPYLSPEEFSVKAERTANISQETFEIFALLNHGVIEGTISYPTFTGSLRAIKKQE